MRPALEPVGGSARRPAAAAPRGAARGVSLGGLRRSRRPAPVPRRYFTAWRARGGGGEGHPRLLHKWRAVEGNRRAPPPCGALSARGARSRPTGAQAAPRARRRGRGGGGNGPAARAPRCQPLGRNVTLDAGFDAWQPGTSLRGWVSGRWNSLPIGREAESIAPKGAAALKLPQALPRTTRPSPDTARIRAPLQARSRITTGGWWTMRAP